jgi:molybdopterin converting factor small subunit
MEININAPATFRRPDLMKKTLQVEEGTTVTKLMEEFKISKSFVQFALVNDQKVEMSQELQDGDSLKFMPMMTGG